MSINTLRLGLQKRITEEFARVLEPGHSIHLFFKAKCFSKIPLNVALFDTSERKPDSVDINSANDTAHQPVMLGLHKLQRPMSCC